MHGVAGKALTVYAVVAQHMPVEAVVVPHLLDTVVLKEVFEDGKHLLAGILQHSQRSNHNKLVEAQQQGMLQSQSVPRDATQAALHTGITARPYNHTE